MPYLLDSDVFIQAKNLHYGLDFCPAFWEWLVRSNAADRVYSIEKVGDEIEAGDDELKDWAAERGEEFFLKPDTAVVQALGQVSKWVTSQHYEAAAVNTFLQVADCFLVAHALAYKHTVVTHEKAAPLAKKIKIPTVCIPLGIKCMTPYEMLRRERARFVLGAAKGMP